MRVHCLRLGHRLAANLRNRGVVDAGYLRAERDGDEEQKGKRRNQASHRILKTQAPPRKGAPPQWLVEGVSTDVPVEMLLLRSSRRRDGRSTFVLVEPISQIELGPDEVRRRAGRAVPFVVHADHRRRHLAKLQRAVELLLSLIHI